MSEILTDRQLYRKAASFLYLKGAGDWWLIDRYNDGTALIGYVVEDVFYEAIV